MFPNSFNKASITLIQKSDKDTARNKIMGQYPDGQSCKYPQENISKLSSTIHEKDHNTGSNEIYFKNAKMVPNP